MDDDRSLNLDLGVAYPATLKPRKRNRGEARRTRAVRYATSVPVTVRVLAVEDARPALSYRVDGVARTLLTEGGRLYGRLPRPARYADDEGWLRDVAPAPVEGEADPFRRTYPWHGAGPEPDLSEYVVASGKDEEVARTVARAVGTVLVAGTLWSEVDEPYLHATHVDVDGRVEVRVAVVETKFGSPKVLVGRAFRMDRGDDVRPFYEAAFPGRVVEVAMADVECRPEAPMRLAVEEAALLDEAFRCTARMGDHELRSRPLEFMVAYCQVRDVARVAQRLAEEGAEGERREEGAERLRDALEEASRFAPDRGMEMAVMGWDVAQAGEAARRSAEANALGADQDALTAMAP